MIGTLPVIKPLIIACHKAPFVYKLYNVSENIGSKSSDERVQVMYFILFCKMRVVYSRLEREFIM